jgi:hypothetical protein
LLTWQDSGGKTDLTANNMSTEEYEVMDELYFIRSFQELLNELKWDEKKLYSVLSQLFQKGWIRCYSNPLDEILTEHVKLESNYRQYHYFASKEGLKAHTSLD